MYAAIPRNTCTNVIASNGWPLLRSAACELNWVSTAIATQTAPSQPPPARRRCAEHQFEKLVAKRRAQRHLRQNRDRHDRPRACARRAIRASSTICGPRFQDGDVKMAMATVRREEQLRQAGVRDADRPGQQEKAQSSLPRTPCRITEAQRGKAELAHPRPIIRAPEPERQDDRHEADRRGDHAVAVLVEDSARHRRH